MKNKLIFFTLVAAMLSSCTNIVRTTIKNASKSEETSKCDSISESKSSEDAKSNEEATISKDTTNGEDTTSRDDSPAERVGTVEIKFAGFNDFHGHIEEEGDMVGLAKLGTYLKAKKKEGTITINSGDSWQETYLASECKGTIISKILKESGLDVYTLGNHDFDWGVDKIRLNESTDYYGEEMLGANIMNYPKFSTNWTKADLGKEYKTFVLNKGTDKEIKIGVIGVIGKNQLGSITSKFVEDYVFYDHNAVIKNVSEKLRKTEHCDIVIASCHAPANELDYTIFNKNSDGTRKYIDAAFCAHDHRTCEDIINDVPVIEGLSYGKYGSEITLNFDFNTKTVVDFSLENVKLANLNLKPDEQFKSEIEQLKTECDNKGNTVYGYCAGYMSKNNMARWQAKVAAEKALELGYNIDYSCVNNARGYLQEGPVNYYEMYETHPFVNDLYVVEVNGHELLNELNLNYFYRIKPDGLIDSYNVWYTIVVYNYVLFHVSINDETYEKRYNYFPSLNDGLHTPILLEDKGVRVNVLDLTISDLTSKGSVNPSDYSGNTWRDNVSYLTNSY